MFGARSPDTLENLELADLKDVIRIFPPTGFSLLVVSSSHPLTNPFDTAQSYSRT